MQHNDDLDWATPTVSVARLHRCAVCQARTDVLLCRECAAEPEQSHARVTSWLVGNSTHMRNVCATWDAVRGVQEDAWAAIAAARSLDDYAQRCAAHRAAQNVYGFLLDAYDAYQRALQPLVVERARLEKALALLEAL